MVEYHVHVRSTDQFKQVGVCEKNDRNEVKTWYWVKYRSNYVIKCILTRVRLYIEQIL